MNFFDFIGTWWGLIIFIVSILAIWITLSIVLYKQFFKRFYDFIIALVAMPFLALLIIPISIAIKIEDKGPVFYCGKRIGRNGKQFKMIKFRSMKVNAPDIRLTDGSTYNGDDDPRVTKIGKILRKTSLDELPQLFNILIGQMSLIGPRPDTVDQYDKYSEEDKKYLKVRPGITGYNQAYFRNSISSQQKIDNDVYYVGRYNIFFDIMIFFKTIQTVFTSKNVFTSEELLKENTSGEGVKKEQGKILIVGASILQLPAILKAKEMGLYVAVADYNPKAVGISYSDEYFNCSTIDREGLLNIAKEYKPDGIMTMATDMPMRSIAYVCEKMNLPCITIETSEICTDKLRMIERFKEKNVASPWYYSAKTHEEILGIAQKCEFPCIMKPVDSSGSRGVVLCKDANELYEEYNYAVEHSMSKMVIVEEYMQGKEVSVEVFVDNGDPHVLQVTDKLTTGSPHFVEMGHSEPSMLESSTLEEIRELAKKAVLALGILNGPAHVEIMATKSGAKIIEIGARMGGDCITSHLVPLSTGVDMTKNTILYALGKPLELSSTIKKCSAIRFLKVEKVGTLKSICGLDEAKASDGIIDAVITKNIGDTITNIHSSTDRIGHVIAQADTVDNAVKFCIEAMKKVIIEIGE